MNRRLGLVSRKPHRCRRHHLLRLHQLEHLVVEGVKVLAKEKIINDLEIHRLSYLRLFSWVLWLFKHDLSHLWIEWSGFGLETVAEVYAFKSLVLWKFKTRIGERFLQCIRYLFQAKSEI